MAALVPPCPSPCHALPGRCHGGRLQWMGVEREQIQGKLTQPKALQPPDLIPCTKGLQSLSQGLAKLSQAVPRLVLSCAPQHHVCAGSGAGLQGWASQLSALADFVAATGTSLLCCPLCHPTAAGTSPRWLLLPQMGSSSSSFLCQELGKRWRCQPLAESDSSRRAEQQCQGNSSPSPAVVVKELLRTCPCFDLSYLQSSLLGLVWCLALLRLLWQLPEVKVSLVLTQGSPEVVLCGAGGSDSSGVMLRGEQLSCLGCGHPASQLVEQEGRQPGWAGV